MAGGLDILQDIKARESISDYSSDLFTGYGNNISSTSGWVKIAEIDYTNGTNLHSFNFLLGISLSNPSISCQLLIGNIESDIISNLQTFEVITQNPVWTRDIYFSCTNTGFKKEIYLRIKNDCKIVVKVLRANYTCKFNVVFDSQSQSSNNNLQFAQTPSKTVLEGILSSISYPEDKLFIVKGCEITGSISPGTYNIQPGTVLYNNEFYEVVEKNGMSFTTIPFFTIDIDSVFSSVKRIKLDESSNPLSICSIEDYTLHSQIDYYNKWNNTLFRQLIPTNADFSGWYDINGRGLSSDIRRGFALCNGYDHNGLPTGIDLRGRTPIGINSLVNFTLPIISIRQNIGARDHYLTADESGLPIHAHLIQGQTGGDNNDHTNNAQFAAGDKGPGDNTYYDISEPSVTQPALLPHNNMQPSTGVVYIERLDNFWYNS